MESATITHHSSGVQAPACNPVTPLQNALMHKCGGVRRGIQLLLAINWMLIYPEAEPVLQSLLNIIGLGLDLGINGD